MPKPRTPLKIAEATGAVDKNPGRFAERKNEPKPQGPMGDPPDYFTTEQIRLWNKIVATVPAGVLTSADCFIVELTALLLQKLMEGEIKPVEIGHLRASLASMGLTPADRSRVTGSDEPKKEDPLAVILGADGFGHVAPN